MGVILNDGQSKKIWQGNMADSPRYCSWTLFFVEIILLKKIWEGSTMNLGQERISSFVGRRMAVWQTTGML